MSKHHVRAVTVVLAALLTGASAAPVQLVFRQIDPPGEIGALTTAVNAWNASHPDVQVRLQSIAGNEALNAYTREALAGGGPDIVQIGFAFIPDLIQAKLVTDLTPFEKSAPIVKSGGDFLATDLTRAAGKDYAVPWTADTFAMVYRPDLFKKAGITRFPTTWAAFANAAKKLTRDTDGNGRVDQYGFCFSGGSGANSSIWFLANYYLWSNGQALIKQGPDGKWTTGISARDLSSAIGYFNNFFSAGITPKSMVGMTSYADPELTAGIGRGDCAITFFPPQTFRAAQATSKVPLQTTAIPTGTKRRVSHLGGRALVINPNSKNQKEAYTFVRYLASTNVMRALPQYPAQRPLLKTIKVPKGEEGFIQLLPKAVTFKMYTGSPAPLSAINNATTRELSATFSGQKSPDTAAQDLLNALNALLKG